MGGSVGTRYLTLATKMQDGWKSKTEAELGKVDGGSIGRKLGGKIMKGLAALQLGQMLVETVQQSLGNYAQYEQLTGGVETMFKKSADTVMAYAQNAYRTTGQSANAYMEQLTGFSASLISSLGGDTAKAAEIGNQAMVDMSDNANKMGTSMDSIQYAYQGFAKQNYTMLDNLKLGYGGSKEEMQRLLDKAEELTGRKFDITNFADIVEAIHAVQEQWDITGTTALEGSTTIEGAMNQMSASWDNLLTGLGDPNADVSALADTFFQQLGNVAMLVAPRLGEIILSLIGVLGQAIQDGINALFGMAVQGISDWWGEVSASWGEYFGQVGEDVGNVLYEKFGRIPERIGDALSGVWGTISGWASGLASSAAGAASGFVGAVWHGITSLPGKFAGILGQIPGKVAGFAGNLASAAKQMVKGMVNGIGDAAGWVISKIQELCSNAEQAIKSFFGIHSPSRLMRRYGNYIGQGLALGIRDSAMAVTNAADVLSKRTARALSINTPASGTATPRNVTVNLNYEAGSDANQMVLDIASGLRRLSLAGGI